MKRLKQAFSCLMDNLPVELKLEILHKLPIKSIGKCMCVSKSWLSLIKNPSFISTHLKLTTHNHLLIFRLSNNQFSLRFDNNEFGPYRVLDLPFEARNGDFKDSGACNGIICLVEGLFSTPSKLVGKKVVLWNPTIQKFLTLPEPNIPIPSLTSLTTDQGPYEVSYGLGFDSSTNDYKVIRIINLESPGDEVPTPQAEIYSLNRNSWRTVTDIFPKYDVDLSSTQAFVNGVLHWIGYRVKRNNSFWCLILCLDMGGEVFREIMLPKCMDDWIPYDIIISVYKESIGVCFPDLFEYQFMEVWVMSEYGNVDSWTKIWRLNWDGTQFPVILGFRNNGEVVREESWEPNREMITSIDLETEEETNVGIREYLYYNSPVSYFVESLVLLDNANAVSYGDIDAIDDSSDDDAIHDSSGDDSNVDASDAHSA